MKTDKPLISIAMAVYEPRIDWLREQLASLNAQTYPNLELNIRDDCSPAVPFDTVCKLAAECITAFPYTIERNENNLGSNGTFERLTGEAKGEYIAYCDQDDVWLPEKISTLYDAIVDQGAALVCSDMYVMDGDGKITADSITQVRRNQVFHSGDKLAEKLIPCNWVTGCAMMLPTEIAKSAMPFCPFMVHDHYLALFCALRGIILCLPERLIKYRIHTANQTLMFAGVHDKKSYVELYVSQVLRRLRWLQERFAGESSITKPLADMAAWLTAREKNLTGRGGQLGVWKYRSFGLTTALFELAVPLMPECVFMWLVEKKRENKI